MITVRFKGDSVTFLRDGQPIVYLVNPTPEAFRAVQRLFLWSPL